MPYEKTAGKHVTPTDNRTYDRLPACEGSVPSARDDYSAFNHFVFSFQIPDGGSSVEIGVYNVAGRLVKTLAAGSMSAGRQSVSWDGTDASGMRMAQGVYFLKAHVGSLMNTYRVIYVAR